eukprot:TRINITY_DN57259_c0_g1_i1.p1 TRINITY_DN57259_c0_g1~~TRINITY_DN57259_c0_g1_i1.p1  ORF type:complete len:118 (-),score=8.78 TRINITY_DN57259_c0_g1_i1:107-460(-)
MPDTRVLRSSDRWRLNVAGTASPRRSGLGMDSVVRHSIVAVSTNGALMSGLNLEHRLAFVAIVNGLRKGGEIGDRTIAAIAHELRAATAVSDDWGHFDTSAALEKIARAIETGGTGQ